VTTDKVRAERSSAAERAWETAIAPARLLWRDPRRVPYPVAVAGALAAYRAADRGERT
jgi:hypothetical protein